MSEGGGPPRAARTPRPAPVGAASPNEPGAPGAGPGPAAGCPAAGCPAAVYAGAVSVSVGSASTAPVTGPASIGR